MFFRNDKEIPPKRRSAHKGVVAAGISLLLLTGCTPASPQKDESSNPTPLSVGAAECAALKGTTVAGVNITAVEHISTAEPVEAGFCQVIGHRAPLLDIEVDLPDDWSGRLYQEGGGGFNGTIRSGITFDEAGGIENIHSALTSHRAVYAASNGGNRADVPAEAAPGLWAEDSEVARESLRDYAYGSLWTTLQFAKGLTDKYYGSSPQRTYFNGCSNGGREAHIVAQRWPSEYDGIVSGCEGGDTGRQVAAWLNFGSRNGTPGEVSPEQYGWAYAAAVKACDSGDGIEDGYLANPAACDFDPAQLSCEAVGDDPLCLTGEQVQTFQTLLNPLMDSDGEIIYEAFSWTDFSALAPQFGNLGSGFAMAATGDDSWLTPERQAGYDLNEDFYEIAYGLLELGADHNQSEIAAYAATGGKLLSWHAAGDNLLAAREHGQMFEELQDRLIQHGIEDPSSNTVYLQVPGNAHGDGNRPGQVDWTTAIIEWVENDVRPSALVYNFKDTEGTQRSLPVCEYPRYPAYTGGNANDAASYECQDN